MPICFNKVNLKRAIRPAEKRREAIPEAPIQMTLSLTASLCLSLPLNYRSQPSLALPHCILIFKPCHTAASKSTETGESSNFHSAWLIDHSQPLRTSTNPTTRTHSQLLSSTGLLDLESVKNGREILDLAVVVSRIETTGFASRLVI